MTLEGNGRPFWKGTVISIHIADGAGEPMRPVAEARAVAGRGLEGDRYYEGRGFYSDHPGPEREVTLIEEETVEALGRDHDLRVEPGETRRNITTRGVPLNHLVGRRFRVGGAVLRGVELCEPCRHLVDVTEKRSLLPTLVHRGGLHAQIIEGGTVREGDDVGEAG